MGLPFDIFFLKITFLAIQFALVKLRVTERIMKCSDKSFCVLIFLNSIFYIQIFNTNCN